MRRLACLIALAIAVPFSLARAGADEDWAVVVKLDDGPGVTPSSREEALRIARGHFAKHRAALQKFIREHPSDPRVFDAKIRLAGIDAAEGKMDSQPAKVQSALQQLFALEKSKDVPTQKLADASFHRISLQMQTFEGRDEELREAVVTAARNFAARFPTDKRSPRLLVEAATQCDNRPDLMRDLLVQARSLSREPALNARIGDDMRRLNTLGKPLESSFSTIQGNTIDLTRLRGKIVVLVFWAAESPHCIMWMQSFLDALRKTPMNNVVVIGISLDENRKSLDEAMKAFGIDWPTHFDGKGWENAVARPLGINAIPTVWVLDKKGVLRTLNARDNFQTWIRKLQLER